jgi:hypothetical protein
MTMNWLACGQMTTPHLKALQDSVEQACLVPAAFPWDRKAAAPAEIFNVLAEVEQHLRTLRYLYRLSAGPAHCASA